MNRDSKPVQVRILEKDYMVACPEEQRDALRESAHYLDRKMRQIRESGKVIGLDRVAVMAALNITHEMLQERALSIHSDRSVTERIRSLQQKIENALEPHEL